MQLLCPQCFLEMIEESGQCFYDWRPDTGECHPAAQEALDKPPAEWTREDAFLVRLENERLEEAVRVLNEFQAWREKMDTMIRQAVEAAESGGIFFHPCSGCPKWEERRRDGEWIGPRCDQYARCR